MKNTGALTLQDLVDQGYTPTQITNLIAGIQEAQAKANAEAKRRAEEEAKRQAELQKQAKLESARKTLAAAWYAYCDAAGVGTEPRDMKFRNDMLNAFTDTADLAGNPNPVEEDVENWLARMLGLAAAPIQ